MTTKEHPILFKGPLVRAILRNVDPKTQTRRLITRLRGFGRVREFGRSDTPGYDWSFRDSESRMHDISDKRLREVLPYQVGDMLWVREGFKTLGHGRNFGLELHYQAYGYDPETQHDERHRLGRIFEVAPDMANKWRPAKFGPWRPSIHMPSWASRIDLEITGVRIQQVKGITEADAIAEGATAMVDERGERRWRIDWSRLGQLSRYASGVTHHGDQRPLTVADIGLGSARMAFANAWREINGNDAWDINPWALALTFRRVRP